MCGNQTRHSFPRSVDGCRHLLCAFALLLGAAPAAATDGYYDTTFGFGGKHLFMPSPADIGATVVRVHILADGTLLLGGRCLVSNQGSISPILCLAWLQPGGTDLNHNYGPGASGNFAPSVGLNLNLSDMAVMPDGRIALLGTNGAQSTIVMVRADGTALDTTVGGGTGVLTLSTVPNGQRIVIQGDGKILLAGSAVAASSTDMAVVRTLADLSGPDPQFNAGNVQTVNFDLGGFNSDIAYAIALQPDGRIVIGGTSTTAAGREPAFARLLADGQIDDAVNDPGDPFGPSVHDGRMHFNFGSTATLNAIAIDRAGNIVFGGSLNNQWLIGRLLKDGSGVDPSFNGGLVNQFLIPPGTAGYQEAKDLVLQSDGRILATGYFPRAGGGYYFGMARLLASGSFDSTFGIAGFGTGTFADGAANLGLSDTGNTLAIGDGGIIVAGFGDVHGSTSDVTEFGVARVQLDLIFEGTFD